VKRDRVREGGGNFGETEVFNNGRKIFGVRKRNYLVGTENGEVQKLGDLVEDAGPSLRVPLKGESQLPERVLKES